MGKTGERERAQKKGNFSRILLTGVVGDMDAARANCMEEKRHARSPMSRALFYLVLASLSLRADFWGGKGKGRSRTSQGKGRDMGQGIRKFDKRARVRVREKAVGTGSAGNSP